jgi:hypothetical protein
MAGIATAEDTTVIKRDSDGDQTVVKKPEELTFFSAPS